MLPEHTKESDRNLKHQSDNDLGNGFIKSITIKNYKTIKNLENFPLRNINILIGANGAGKSNFLSFFDFVKELARNNLEQYVARYDGQDRFLHYGREVSDFIYGNITANDNSSSYEFKLNKTDGQDFKEDFVNGDLFDIKDNNYKKQSDLIEDEIIQFDRKMDALELVEDYKREELDGLRCELKLIINKLEFHKKAQEHIFAQKLQLFHFNNTSVFAPIRISNVDIDDYSYLRHDGANLPAILKLMHDRFPTYYKMICDYISLVTPDFAYFDFDTKEFSGQTLRLKWFSKKNLDKSIAANRLSDGTLRFIALATLLLMPEDLQPQLIIIDEPELGLHPKAIQIIAGLVKRISLKRQFIIATQSKDFIDYFQDEAEDIIVIDRDKLEYTTTLKRLDSEELKDWLEEYTVSELWDMNYLGGKP